ncbi:MAG: hypothetical protein JXB05_06150 [Myxococcaceae bacterium]|nr:hypothetical protein [Myxococcaceae bacterium]
MKRAVFSVCVSAALVVVGCVVSVADFAGKSCEIAEDCPDSYVCVSARPGAGRTCEVLGLPDISDGGEPPQGPVPTWCADIQPLMATYCLSNCHGPETTNSGRDGFRLDFYNSDGGTQVGALEMAPTIDLRVVRFQNMPPLGQPAPTPQERALIGRWATGGAPFCTDGGTPPDGGTDGGG